MPKLLIPKGNTSTLFHVWIPDRFSTDGAGLQGLDNTKVNAVYIRAGSPPVSTVTVLPITTIGSYQTMTGTEMRIGEVGPANVKWQGMYEIQLHDTWVAAGANQLTMQLTDAGANSIPPILFEIQLTNFNLNADPATAADVRDGLCLIETTVANVISPTVIALATGAPDNDAYNGKEVVLIDQANALQRSTRKCTDWVGGASLELTLETTPEFALSIGDRVKILSHASGSGVGGAVADSVLQAIANRGNNNNLNALLGVPDAVGETLAVPGYHVRQGNFIQGSTQDKYTCTWARFGVEVTSGITLPKIQVKNLETGADLIAEAAMTPVAGGEFRHLQGAPSRTVDGTAYKVFYKATIGGAERVDTMDIGRDA